jgi:uncharacterized protein (TIGR01777 family)
MPRTFSFSATVPAPRPAVWRYLTHAAGRLVPPWADAALRDLPLNGVEEGARAVWEIRRPGALEFGPPRRGPIVYRDVEPGRRYREIAAVDETAEADALSEPPGPRAVVLTVELADAADGDATAVTLTWHPGDRVAIDDRRLSRTARFVVDRIATDLAGAQAVGLELPADAHESDRPRVIITGASGMIGSPLRAKLAGLGYDVVQLVRHDRRAVGRRAVWSPNDGTIDASLLDGAVAVVNLSGRPIADQRWTPAIKREIRDSRVRATALLTRTILDLPAASRPPVLVNASATGFYGDRPDAGELDESSPAGAGFLADVCKEWEATTDPLLDTDVRVVNARIGIVIGRDGGALAQLEPIFRLGVGGPIGLGRQWMSWIHVDDVLRGLVRSVQDSRLSGPVNLVAPEPVTNRELTRELGRVLRRPAVLPVPPVAVKLLFGEMGTATVLASARVLPGKLAAVDFPFRYGALREALTHEYER